MENADLNKIRHFKGSVTDFKNYFDQRAGENTNAFGTPGYQGFNNVHPTRGDNQSPHWKTSNLSEGVSKIACLECDEVNTEKAWKKNNGVCPSCNNSTQGAAESISEDIEIGHQDDEPGMLGNDLSVIERYAKELGEMMKELEMQGEVDLPHWWQSKIVLAKEYLVKAKHYLRAELEKDSSDQAIPTFESYKHKG